MGDQRKPDDVPAPDAASMRERYADQMPPDFPEPSPIPLLIREIFQLSQRFERRLGASLSVNTTDLAAMEHLMQNGPMTPSELATRLEMSTAATTHVIDRLVAVGHVERRPHPVDRRKIVVIPAPASVARAFDELAPMIAGVGAAAAAYDPEEQAVIAGFLGSVVDLYAGLVDERSTSGS
ncbi:MarR family winged helix-turn-helix transcriptional regulator [Labedella endophytica]|nr:MarR family winged helix-turn-helix transcriptional regulator [Labedella endophytica]